MIEIILSGDLYHPDEKLTKVMFLLKHCHPSGANTLLLLAILNFRLRQKQTTSETFFEFYAQASNQQANGLLPLWRGLR
jgi:hypothetical protein